MADQRVNINIGTSYSGEGMQKAMGAVDGMSKVAGKAAGAVGSLAGSIEGMSGKAGQAVGNVSRLLGALATGGPLGLAVAGVTALVGAFVSLREEEKKAKEEQEQFQFDAAKRRIDSYQQSVNELAVSLDKAAKFHIAFNNTLTALQTNRAAVDATKALIEGERGGTDITRAEGQRKATAITQAQNIQNAETAVQNARKNWGTANAASDAQDKAVERLRQFVESARQHHQQVYSSTERDDDDEEWQKKAERAALTLAHAEEALAKAEAEQLKKRNEALLAYNETVKAQEALNVVKAKAELENLRAENAVADAKKKAEEERLKEEQKRKDEEEKAWKEEEKAREESIKATWEEVAVRAERNAKFREEERLEKQLREELEKEPKLLDALDKATEDLKNAQEEYAAALRRARAMVPNDDGFINPNGVRPETPNRPGGRRRKGAAANNTDNEGNWNTFAKPEGRDRRYWQTHPDEARANGITPGLSDSQQREYNDLVNKMVMGGKGALSDKQRARWEELKSLNPDDVQNAAEKAAEKAAQDINDKTDRVQIEAEKVANNTKQILTLMNKLGLK